jgi:hypothetical protein
VRSATRRPRSATSRVVLSFGLVAALLGAGMVLKSASGPVSPGSARPTATEQEGTITVSVVRGGDSALTDAESQALRQNLEKQAQEPNPFVTAIRDAVGPEMSEDALNELARRVNLLCVSSTTAQAEARLVGNGMPLATAKAVIERACAIS